MATDLLSRYRMLAAMAIVITGVTFVSIWFRSTNVVLVIRHAEKDTVLCDSTPGNVRLSSAGDDRAQAMKRVAGVAEISAIYASELCRTQQTVNPLAMELGITPIQVTQHNADGSANIDDLINQILTSGSGRVLVAGHSETVPLIIETLGGGSIPEIGPNEYDNLYVLTITRWWWNRWPYIWKLPISRTVLVRLKYGPNNP